MCGLFGAFRVEKSSWGTDREIQTFMYQGLLMSTLRGTSGTGVGLVHKDWEVNVEKSHHAAWDFMELPKYGWAQERFHDSLAIIGHTRAATVQNSYNMNGAHPHMYHLQDDPRRVVMLTHNGHVSNAWQLTPNHFHHPVDSAHVSYAFCIDGANKVLPKLEGGYVLVWYEADTKTMHIAKNQSMGRDLCIAFSKDKKVLYYASEIHFLRMSLERSGINHDGKYQDIKPFTHFTWDLTAENLASPKHVKYDPPKDRWGASRSGGGHGHFLAGSEPRKGQIIWGSIPTYMATRENTLIKYQNGRGNMKDRGQVHAEPFIDTTALVRIGGVSEEEWKDICMYTRMRVPMKVLSVKMGQDIPEDAKLLKPHCRVFIRAILDDAEFKRIIKDKKDYEKSRYHSPVIYLKEESKRLPDLPADSNELVDGPTDKQITKQEWREMAKDGCFICNDYKPVPDEHMGKVRFFPYPRNKEDKETDREYSIICAVCSSDEELMQNVLGS